MYCHCGTNNRAPRWTFTDPYKTEVRPGAREESASPAWQVAPAMNARDKTKVYVWRLDTGCGPSSTCCYIKQNASLCLAGDADSSRAPGLTSGLQGSVNVHRDPWYSIVGVTVTVHQFSFIFTLQSHIFWYNNFNFFIRCCRINLLTYYPSFFYCRVHRLPVWKTSITLYVNRHFNKYSLKIVDLVFMHIPMTSRSATYSACTGWTTTFEPTPLSHL